MKFGGWNVNKVYKTVDKDVALMIENLQATASRRRELLRREGLQNKH
jgi:hypothetical protein